MRPFSRQAGIGVVAAALLVSAAPTHASDLPCFEQSTMQSARIHDLRIMLMVNALKCRVSHPATLRSYGRLLDQRTDELAHHRNQVIGMLIDRYGPAQGRVAFNRYETAISNYHSDLAPSREQCEDVDAFIKLAERADHAELETLSKLVTNRAINSCIVRDEVAFERETKTVVAKNELGARSATAATAPEMVDGVLTFSTPGTGPNTAPEPLEIVSVPAATIAETDEAVAKPTPAADTDQKLDQAILALTAAAAALSDLRRDP